MDQRADEKQIINYLLGELSEDEQRAVEERLLTDDEYYDLLLASEDDLIDDYVRGARAGRAREEFEAHFLRPPERREKLRFAMALRKYILDETAAGDQEAVSMRPRASWWNRLFSAPSLRLAAAAVIILAVGLATWRVIFYESEVNKGVTALNNAYRQQRPVEARISKLDYAPFSVTRGGDQGPVDKLSLTRAERILYDEAEAHPVAASLHALGRLFLAEKKFDEAIEQFENALKLDDKNAQLEGDLGAALLEKAKADRANEEGGKRVEEFARSLEHLSRALELNGSLLEALFNRAILYQYMMLPQQAEEDWQKYIEKDPDSKWADEARQNLRQLEERKKKGRTKQRASFS